MHHKQRIDSSIAGAHEEQVTLRTTHRGRRAEIELRSRERWTENQ